MAGKILEKIINNQKKVLQVSGLVGQQESTESPYIVLDVLDVF